MSAYAVGTTARILGWDTTSVNGELRTASAPIVSDSSCKSSYDSDFVRITMVCAS